MQQLTSTTAAAVVKQALYGGAFNAFQDGNPDANGNLPIHVTDAGGATIDWVYVNPNTGNFTTLGGFEGCLFAPAELLVLVSFDSPGNSNSLSANVSFPAGVFVDAPTIEPGNIIQTVPYCDVMSYPFIANVTANGFQVTLHPALRNTDVFGAGTLKMYFKATARK